jgi:tryptophan-rich sensory protein
MSTLVQLIFPTNFDNNKTVFFQPPGYVFAINWTIIYTLLGVYLYKLFYNVNDSVTQFVFMLSLYVVNLTLNMMWTPIVNHYKKYKAGIFVIAGMILTALMMISIDTENVRRTLLIPYVSWLLVALLLNIELARMYITPQK